ncbi:MAG: tyrosine-protein phosphatase, partial [Acholeplasmataceae bacterium]
MTHIKNFRELAKGIYNHEGKKIKPNLIFRSGELSKASNNEIQEMVDYGIKTIYDLRNPYEQQIQINHPGFEIYGFNISQSTAKKRM